MDVSFNDMGMRAVGASVGSTRFHLSDVVSVPVNTRRLLRREEVVHGRWANGGLLGGGTVIVTGHLRVMQCRERLGLQAQRHFGRARVRDVESDNFRVV